MPVSDPVDARLLAMLADMGRVAIHELAARAGMDPREVAYRLVALSGSGLPLLVGVECDPNGVRAAVAHARPWHGHYASPPSGPHPVHGTPSAAHPMPGGQPVPRQPPRPPAAQHARVDSATSTWGPPQSASWARGD